MRRQISAQGRCADKYTRSRVSCAQKKLRAQQECTVKKTFGGYHGKLRAKKKIKGDSRVTLQQAILA